MSSTANAWFVQALYADLWAAAWMQGLAFWTQRLDSEPARAVADALMTSDELYRHAVDNFWDFSAGRATVLGVTFGTTS